ncbi:lysophospholipase [Phyllosticta capitalensis]
MALLKLCSLSFLLSSAVFAADYAPVSSSCPSSSTTLVREASSGLSTEESTWAEARKAIADEALATWLAKQNSAWAEATTLPKLALSSSGGGYRAMLGGAGVIKGFDSRDSNVSTSGLWQALTYHAGLSGGAWLVASVAGNNWPTVSSLVTGLWNDTLDETLLLAEGLDGAIDIVANLKAKEKAGFDTTLTDSWGRLLSYQILYGDDGGVNKTLSGIAEFTEYTSHNAPFPIMTSTGVEVWDGQCSPDALGTQYEFSPLEFGSWDSGVAAFVPTEYLGSSLSNGAPSGSDCVTGYDQLGYMFGTSSSLFNLACIPADVNATEIGTLLYEILIKVHEAATKDLFGVFPNPFYEYTTSSDVSAQDTLYLVDGAESGQNIPLWPLIQPARGIDVIFANDLSADTDYNWPNGTEILQTYTTATAEGLTTMPQIPSVDTFLSEGLNTRPVFFGCNDADVITIIYLPNYNYSYASNVSTLQLEYEATETAALVANGVEIASYGGKADFGPCMACGIMQKSGATLPSECTDCLASYCYN